MRQLYEFDANESIRRLVEDGMSRGLTNTHTARGILFYITCSLVKNAFSVLHYVIKVTLHYLIRYIDSGFILLGTFAHGFSGCRLAASRFVASRLLVGNYVQLLNVVFKMSIRIQFVTTTGHTFPTKNYCSFFKSKIMFTEQTCDT